MNTAEAEWAEIFVELKGVDVAHAISQLRETLKNSYFKAAPSGERRARIVASSFPSNKSNPVMEKAKAEFRKAPFSCDLRGFKTGQKDRI